MDFRARVQDEDVGQLAAFCEALAARYPHQRPIRQLQGQVRFGDDGITAQETNTRRYGYRLTSADEKHVLQVRPDGFTFSRLRPYESWDAMVDEAWETWKLYVADLRPPGLSRVATRFINVLQIHPGEPLDRLLAEPPKVPDGLPTVLTHFLFRYVTQATEGIVSSVSLATEEGSRRPSLVLDIDCFARRDFSVSERGMEIVRDTLEQLRARKNQVFFKTITPEAIEEWI